MMRTKHRAGLRAAIIVVAVGCLVGLHSALAAAAAAGSYQASDAGEPLIAAYGDGIGTQLLDGSVGAEWSDSAVYVVRMGDYEAELRLKHDGVWFYVAMTIRSGEFFAAGFEAYVVFDNEDGQEYSRGDDMMSVSAAQGQLLDADYYYRNTFDFVLDVQSAGASHAVGAGAYDSASRCYVFEFRREIASGDDRDVPMDLAGASATTYGWASY